MKTDDPVEMGMTNTDGKWIGETYVELAPSIWTSPSIPNHWIAEDNDGSLYLVPAIHNGWDSRRPYRGYKARLTRVAAETARVIEADLGKAFELATLSIGLAWHYMDYQLN